MYAPFLNEFRVYLVIYASIFLKFKICTFYIFVLLQIRKILIARGENYYQTILTTSVILILRSVGAETVTAQEAVTLVAVIVVTGCRTEVEVCINGRWSPQYSLDCCVWNCIWNKYWRMKLMTVYFKWFIFYK